MNFLGFKFRRRVDDPAWRWHQIEFPRGSYYTLYTKKMPETRMWQLTRNDEHQALFTLRMRGTGRA